MNFINKKIEIYEFSNDTHCVLLKDHRLANKLNKLLKYYEDYKFVKGEEPIFKIQNSKLKGSLIVLGLTKLL